MDRTEINGATDVVPGTHKLSPLLGYGGRQPHRPENEPDYNKLLIQVLTLTLPTLIQRSSLCHLDINIAQMHRLIEQGSFHDIMSSEGHLTTERVHRPQRMALKKGDIWLHDPRIFHRGAPNNGDDTTPNLLLTYRSEASPSPIRGLFGRQLTENEMATLPNLGLSDKVRAFPCAARSQRSTFAPPPLGAEHSRSLGAC